MAKDKAFFADSTNCLAPFCDNWPWADPGKDLGSSDTGTSKTDAEPISISININTDYRLRSLIGTIRSKIGRAVTSVEDDIFQSNVNNIVLALSNALAGNFTQRILSVAKRQCCDG